MPVLPPLHPFNHLHDAREAALNAALGVRYGSLSAAPTAAMIAGAPLVLYVKQSFLRGGRVHLGGEVKGEGDDGLKEWENICAGLAVVEEVEVEEVHFVRAVVGGRLREAVKSRGLAPVLVVVQMSHDGELAMGADVLRAVCDGYGARLHVEGDGVGMLLGGGEVGVKAMAGVAHSVLVDVGAWFGRLGTAVMLGVAGGGEGTAWLGGVMSLWFLLERVHLQRCRKLLEAACEGAKLLVEGLYSVPHLLEVKIVGSARHALVSYAVLDASAEMTTAVNWAMFAHLQRTFPQFRHLLVMGRHENREWLVFSPMHVFNGPVDATPVSNETIRALCQDSIYAARRCEMVVSGKAAFISQTRQCQDVEVESLVTRRKTDSSKLLFFAALRVTPFREVSRNGHWKKDEEMAAKVEKYTCALASLLEELKDERFEAIIQDPKDENTEVPMIYVGPLFAEASPESNGEEAIDGAEETTDASALCTVNAALAERWNLDESTAQELALKAAETITAVVSAALNAEGEATHETGNQETDNTSGIASAEIESEQMVNGQIGDIPTRQLREPTAPDHLNVQKTKSVAEETAVPHIAKNKTEIKGMNNENENGEDETVEGEERVTDTQILARENARKKGQGTERKKRGSIWGLLFGEDPADAESTGSVDSSKDLEDDYFRP